MKTPIQLLIASFLTLNFVAAHRAAAQMNKNSIRVEGATEAQLSKISAAIHTAAYGVDGKSKDKLSRIDSRFSEPTSNDECREFYWPPAKFRLIKNLPAVDPCVGQATGVLADTDIQVIFLCKDGKTVGDYDFSMGRGGVNKKSLGDKRTPLGRYPLGKPRGSEKFKAFIPIGYPTKSQAAQGYTGAFVGIHGPARPFRCAGFLNTAVNWTLGCLAVSSDAYIKEISRFVQENDVKEISISPLEGTSEIIRAKR